MSGTEESLRGRVLRGGVYLTLRQGLGLALHVGGVILLTRLIGPENYGLYAASLAITTYLSELSQWGVGVYLVRRSADLDRRVLRLASTLLLGLAFAAVAVGEALVPSIARWIDMPGLEPVVRVLVLGLPFLLLASVAVRFRPTSGACALGTPSLHDARHSRKTPDAVLPTIGAKPASSASPSESPP